MKKNMGSADRIIRFLAAAGTAVLFFTNIISGTAAIVLLVIATVLLLTGLLGSCPLYSLVGLNTCRTKRPVVRKLRV